MVRMMEMARSQLPLYSRMKPDTDRIQPSEQPDPLLHNLDNKKLLRRCAISLIAVLIIAISLWIFDPPAGHETKPTPENTGTRLKFIALVHRHGARSAIHDYEFEKEIHWEVPPGKLLDIGFRNGFKFGQKLLQRYSSGPGSITPSSVAAFTTNVNRTIDTVHSVLIGLFSPENTTMGEANCTCRPVEKQHSSEECVAKCIGVEKPMALPNVTIWDKESRKDVVLQQFEVCEGQEDYVKKLRKSKEIKDATEGKFEEALDYLAKEIVKKDSVVDNKAKETSKIDLDVLTKIWGNALCLAAQEDHTGPYEDDPAKVAEKLEDAALFWWRHMYSTEIGPKIGGIFLDQIIKDLKQGTKRTATSIVENRRFSAPEKSPLMKIYSAHDSTLSSLLAAMNYEDWKFPYFLSNIIFELYGPADIPKADLKSHYIRVLYNDEPLKLGHCDDAFCPIIDFLTPMKERTRTIHDCKRIKEESS